MVWTCKNEGKDKDLDLEVLIEAKFQIVSEKRQKPNQSLIKHKI